MRWIGLRLKCSRVLSKIYCYAWLVWAPCVWLVHSGGNDVVFFYISAQFYSVHYIEFYTFAFFYPGLMFVGLFWGLLLIGIWVVNSEPEQVSGDGQRGDVLVFSQN